MTDAIFDENAIAAKGAKQVTVAEALEQRKLAVWEHIKDAMSGYKDNDWDIVAQSLTKAANRAYTIQELNNLTVEVTEDES